MQKVEVYSGTVSSCLELRRPRINVLEVIGFLSIWLVERQVLTQAALHPRVGPVAFERCGDPNLYDQIHALMLRKKRQLRPYDTFARLS